MLPRLARDNAAAMAKKPTPPTSTGRPFAFAGIPTLDQLMAQAQALHQAGKLAQAEPVYREVLRRSPPVQRPDAPSSETDGCRLESPPTVGCDRLRQPDVGRRCRDARLRVDPRHLIGGEVRDPEPSGAAGESGWVSDGEALDRSTVAVELDQLPGAGD